MALLVEFLYLELVAAGRADDVLQVLGFLLLFDAILDLLLGSFHVLAGRDGVLLRGRHPVLLNAGLVREVLLTEVVEVEVGFQIHSKAVQ